MLFNSANAYQLPSLRQFALFDGSTKIGEIGVPENVAYKSENAMRANCLFPTWLEDHLDVHPLVSNNRAAACIVLLGLDYDSQLAAIHHVLREHQEANSEREREIAEIEKYARKTSGWRNDRAVEEWIDRLHRSVYEDAARSMAAVGMLAPLVESIFSQAFQGIRAQFYNATNSLPVHDRWQRPAEDQWDCHFVWSNGRRNKDLVGGIVQLASAIELTAQLPKDMRPVLQALFEYRNKMFHCGFEWPMHERRRFDKRISEANWPSEWFEKATRGGDPWVIYLTGTFITRCTDIIVEIIEGIGAYCNLHLKA